MALPTKKTEPKKDLGAFSILLYGESKFGKSTICSKFPDAYFIATEPGLKSLSVFKDDVTTWKGCLDKINELIKEKHSFKTVILDTVDNLYKFCSEHICKELSIKHESDLSFGKGFAMVNSEFERVLTRLSMLPMGLILISHSQIKEIDTRTGKIKKFVPTLPESARKIVMRLVDLILYCDMEIVKDDNGKFLHHKRVIRTKPHISYDAGDRTSRLPDTIDFDYDVFVKEFTKEG